MKRRAVIAAAAGTGLAVSGLAAGGEGIRIESAAHDPGADAVIGVNDQVTVAATAVDPDGRLDTIEWIDGRNRLVFEMETVSGSEATSTVSFDEVPRWIRHGYATEVRTTTTDGRDTGIVEIEAPSVRRPYAVDIVDTSEPLSGGERFEATVRVEDVGELEHVGPSEQEIHLRVGGDLVEVDSTTVDLGYDETTEVTLGYETYPVQQDVEFPVRAEGLDNYDEIDVQVAAATDTTPADEDTRVTITDVEDEGVRGGETLTVVADVENAGETAVDTFAYLVSVGKGAVVNEVDLSLAPGETRTVRFGYRTYPVQTDVEFEMAVCTPHDSDVATVSVAGIDPDEREANQGPITASIYQTTAPVTGGDRLEVTASLANNGTVETTAPIELVVGDEVVDSRDVAFPRRSTKMVALGYDTYPVRSDVEFPATIRTPDASATAMVTVHGTEESGADGDEDDSEGDDGDGQAGPVSVSVDATSAPVTGGDRLEVAATLSNAGDAAASATPELVVGGDVVDSRSVTVAGGSSQSITLGYDTYPVESDVQFPVTVRTADDSASTQVTVHGTGSDDGSGDDGDQASLSVTVTGTSAPVDAGDRLDVTATIQNSGAAQATETAELVVGGEVVDTQRVSVGADSARTIRLGHSTYPVEQDVTFPVTVRVGGATDSRSVTVRGSGG